MNFIKLLLLFMAISCGHPSFALAGDQIEIPKEDTEYKYYLGIAESVPTYKDAINQAFEQAVSDAIRDNYGFEASISADTYLTENNSQIMKRFRQNSKKINLKGFERVDMKIKNTNDKYTIQMLYKYSKKAIALELISLKLAKDPALNENISEFGGTARNNLGGIEINTEPAGAYLFLNDDPYLKSPIKVNNQIAPGRYTLTIDHPIYETIKEEIIILPNEITKITKTLVPAFGWLNIDTTPGGAEVFIDNKSAGKTPLLKLQLPAGAIFKLKLEHPNAFTQTYENMSVDKNQLKSETIALKLKPGRLQLIVENKPDAIYIENEKVSLDQKIFERPSGYYTIKVLKAGFEDYYETVVIEPETTTTKKISLTKIAAPVEVTKSEYISKSKFEMPGAAYFQINLLYETMSSPLSDSKNHEAGGQSELSLGHADYIGFFTSATSYAKTSETKTYGYSAGDLATVKKATIGVWFYTTSYDNNSSLSQWGFFKEQAKISQYTSVSTGTYYTELQAGKSVDFRGYGLVYNYCHIGSKAVTFDFRLGMVNYEPVLKSNVKMETSFFMSLGIGWDVARTIKNWRN